MHPPEIDLSAGLVKACPKARTTRPGKPTRVLTLCYLREGLAKAAESNCQPTT